jgi:hypothetical protein
MYYINIKNNGQVETVDEFSTKKEADEMVKEYNISDRANSYYISTRSTKEWMER